jgi:P27 family predicted phage terminase small subunit
MARRGPKPKLKIAESDARTVGRSTPLRVVDPPFELGEISRAEWDRYAPILVRAKRLDEINAPAFACYCEAFEFYTRARQDMGLDVSLITDSGGTKANPSAALALKSLDTMLKFLREFGLTPATLRSLGESAKEVKVNRLAEFIANG